MKCLSPSLLALAFAATGSIASAVDVSDADLKLGLVLQLQTRMEMASAKDTAGNDYSLEANGAGNASFDPLFVNAGGGDYHLSPASLAINSGSNPEAPAKDKDGISRPVGLWADIGAYESLFGYPLHLPLIGR